jgi:hypothetical protein
MESKGVQAVSGSDLLRENRGYNETLKVVRAEKDKAIVRNGRGETRVVFAEGDGDEIRLAFSTHDIQITGGRLDALLFDIVAQRVTLLREPMRADSFTPEAAPRITGIAVRKAE